MKSSRKKIIEAAIECLRECPIDQMSMRNIAEKAGVTTGSIYHHFKNKDELTFAVMNESLHFSQKLYENMKDSSDISTTKLIETINEAVANRLRKTDQQILHVLFFSEIIKRKSKITNDYREHYKKIIESTTNMLVMTYEADYNKAENIARILVASVDGIAMQQSLNVMPKEIENFVEAYILFFNEAIPKFLSK